MPVYHANPLNNHRLSSDSQLDHTNVTDKVQQDDQELIRRNRPDPDPIEELATIDAESQDNRPDRPQLASQPGPKPGFGPNPNADKLIGNPELGIDPRDAAGSWENGPKAP